MSIHALHRQNGDIVEFPSKKPTAPTPRQTHHTLTAWQHGSVTADLAGIGPLRTRVTKVFEWAVSKYSDLLDTHLQALTHDHAIPYQEIADLATRIGEQYGSPRDIIDIHISAVEAKCQNAHPKRAQAYAMEGRLLALEVMGYLTDYYRIGSPQLPEAPREHAE